MSVPTNAGCSGARPLVALLTLITAMLTAAAAPGAAQVPHTAQAPSRVAGTADDWITYAEVAWLLPEGRYSYWRGAPREVSYELAPAR